MSAVLSFSRSFVFPTYTPTPQNEVNPLGCAGHGSPSYCRLRTHIQDTYPRSYFLRPGYCDNLPGLGEAPPPCLPAQDGTAGLYSHGQEDPMWNHRWFVDQQ